MTDKILIANRGEIACRIIHSVQAAGLKAVAVHSDADAGARHVRMADEAVHIGPSRASESYLDAARILDAARATRARAVHPGYGFLAENAGFAASCGEAGLIFIGPDPQTIRRMGDKQQARAAAMAAGVPVLLGSDKLDPQDEAAIITEGERIGFPILVKAAGGGGGIGLRPVASADKLVKAVRGTSAQAERAFADPAVYLERLVRRARHVEVQIFGRGTEAPLHLFCRECSLQRRYQKVVEEAQPANVTPAATEGMIQAALDLARAVQYDGAGTVEFLYDDETGNFYFMEMNTRLQVEHPVTEMVTNQDLVALQLAHALGQGTGLEQADIRARGHAIEMRICAEDPARQFMPAPGSIARLDLPELPGVRIDTGVETGDAVTPFYDSLMLKIIAHGPDRGAAIDRLREALALTRIEGLTTNLAFLARLLEHPDYAADRLHTRFIEDNLPALTAPGDDAEDTRKARADDHAAVS